MKLAVMLLGMVFSLAMPVFGLDIVTEKIKFSDDPVEILTAWAALAEEKYGTELYCHLEYVNRSGNAIDTVSFRMLFYDIFNEYLDTVSGVSISKLSTREAARSSWKVSVYKEWSTHTVIVFLDRVRFADGAVRRRSEDEITSRLTNSNTFCLIRSTLRKKGKNREVRIAN